MGDLPAMSEIKQFLGKLPYTAEVYWWLRQRDSPTTVGVNLSRLKENLPKWIQVAEKARKTAPRGKKVLVFGMIHYWIEYAALLSSALAGMAHEVTLATMPSSHWRKPENNFDLRRQNIYILNVLQRASSLINNQSLYAVPGTWYNVQNARYSVQRLAENSDVLLQILHNRALRDTQYALLTEEVETGSELYNMRLERDTIAFQAAVALLQENRPDVVITPNGSILEFGAVYEAARYLGVPVSTFEFGEQNYRMWLAQNDDVMRQDTTALWHAFQDTPLGEAEWERIRTMFEARQGARNWETFERTWQTAESMGAALLKHDLGLDERPLAFLPTNVLGDSLTLGRQVFTGMTEWVRRTIRWFGDHPEYQLVVRVHPGESIGWGPSTYELLQESFPEFPPNTRVLPADYEVNSYDLVEAASLGLVYTTTLGLEMAMLGRPVIVTGQTHYRGKGFTQDPQDWEAYERLLAAAMADPAVHAPNRSKVEQAWTYAYRFFFEYPQPFPWHIQHFNTCIKEWPLEKVLSDEGKAAFGRTFEYLVGETPLFGTGS